MNLIHDPHHFAFSAYLCLTHSDAGYSIAGYLCISCALDSK
jgi:hypothetical protein